MMEGLSRGLCDDLGQLQGFSTFEVPRDQKIRALGRLVLERAQLIEDGSWKGRLFFAHRCSLSRSAASS